MKKLELGNILIHDVQFSNEGSKVENGVLYVNKEEICKIALEDENIASCEVFLARPGESVLAASSQDGLQRLTPLAKARPTSSRALLLLPPVRS